MAGALNLVQTTSPSYLLLASLDVARHQVESNGRALWAATVDLALMVRDKLCRTGIPCLKPEEVRGPAALDLDVTRLVIPTLPLGLRGEEAAALLRSRYAQEVEMAGQGYLLVLLTPGDGAGKAGRLVEALAGLTYYGRGVPLAGLAPGPDLPGPPVPEVVLTPREAFFAPRRRLSLKEAVGKVAAEIIALYPPGYFLLAPGELITVEVVDYLSRAHEPEDGIMVVE